MNFGDIKTLTSFTLGSIALLIIVTYLIAKSPIIGTIFVLLLGFIIWAIMESKKTEFKKGRNDK